MAALKLLLIQFLLSVVFINAACAQSDSALISKGKKQYESGKYRKALKTYIKATKVNPKSALAYRLAGETYFRIVKLEKALSAFRTSIILDSTDHKTLLCLGITLARQFTKTKDFKLLSESDSIYNKIISKNYEPAYTYMQMAYNYYYRRQYAKTWECLYMVKKIDDKYLNLRFVVDFYIDHPDPGNVFNITKTPFR